MKTFLPNLFFLPFVWTLAQAKPNVLFVVCDDLNTHVSTSGYEPILTPNLSKLAKESMTFNRAFCQYPVCGPSRASFLLNYFQKWASPGREAPWGPPKATPGGLFRNMSTNTGQGKESF